MAVFLTIRALLRCADEPAPSGWSLYRTPLAVATMNCLFAAVCFLIATIACMGLVLSYMMPAIDPALWMLLFALPFCALCVLSIEVVLGYGCCSTPILLRRMKMRKQQPIDVEAALYAIELAEQ